MQSLLHFKKQHKFQAQTFKKRWPPISVGLERALNTLEPCCRLAGFAAVCSQKYEYIIFGRYLIILEK